MNGHRRQLTFDRDPGEVLAGRTKSGALKVNPCVLAYGPGPEGRKCGDCVNLYQQGGVAGTYYKCALRLNTSGPGSDHRFRWPACARFEPRPS
jgi:hypothetical protein